MMLRDNYNELTLQTSGNHKKIGTNLNHEHIRRGWIDSRRAVLLARELLAHDAGAEAAEVLGSFEGAQRVEVGQDCQSLNNLL